MTDALLMQAALDTTWSSRCLSPGWNASTEPCAWGFIRCSNFGPFGAPSLELEIDSCPNMTGSANDAIAALASSPALASILDALTLDFRLTGTIPDSLGKLTALSGLTIQSKDISGTIPDSIGELTALSMLFLANPGVTSRISGTIPDSMGQLNHLGYVQLPNVHGCSSFCKHKLPRVLCFCN
eukprot:SAG31_NODE_3480_length_4223_cov_23.570078_2_plen_183_part_00